MLFRSGRPTVILALALEGLGGQKRMRLDTLLGEETISTAALCEVRRLFEEAGAFLQSEQLIAEHQERAQKIAQAVAPDELRRLLYYLIDMVLQRPRGSA